MPRLRLVVYLDCMTVSDVALLLFVVLPIVVAVVLLLRRKK